MYARPKQTWFALIQLAITGIYGGIDGTLLNRGGDTMYGSITPYKRNAADLGSSSLPWNYIYASNYKGEASDVVSSFNQASTRNNLTSGDTLRTIFGKISKWFADLGQLAFKNKISKDDLDNDLQNSLNNNKGGAITGSYVGNGSNTRTISFNIEPAIIIIYMTYSTSTYQTTVIAGASTGMGNKGSSIPVKVEGKNLIMGPLSTMLDYINRNNVTYYYTIIPKN